MDAFRYFNRGKNKFDLIISEPTNLWTAGVENLFTTEFYKMINSSLSENGIFLQWNSRYIMSKKIFVTVINNLIREYKFVQMIELSTSDIVFIASNKPFKNKYMKIH